MFFDEDVLSREEVEGGCVTWHSRLTSRNHKATNVIIVVRVVFEWLLS